MNRPDEIAPPKSAAKPAGSPAEGAKAAPKRKPEIKIRERERESLSPLPIVAGIILLVVGSAFAVFFKKDTVDPHFERAKLVLERYELGKPEESRDYEHAAYTEALAELALVDRASTSAPPADALVEEIRRQVARQQARVRARSVEMQARQQIQQQRDEEFFRMRRLNPPPPLNAPTPECEEGPGHSAGGAAHTH